MLVIYIMQMLAGNPFMDIDFADQEKYDEDSDDNSEHFYKMLVSFYLTVLTVITVMCL